MAGISAKFSHITLGTIFGTFQPATVGCCQKVQLCSNSNNTNRILWSAKSGWKFGLLWSQRASIAWQGKSRVVDDCSSPILADWSFPWLPDYIFLDCQIIFSHKLIFGAAPLFVELIAELALVLLLRESFPEASIGRPISLRQPSGEKSCGAGRCLFSLADSFQFLSSEDLQSIKWKSPLTIK